jgi:hypothetical protein
MISGFGENKFHKRYLDSILEKAKSLNIYNIDDIAYADELCCKEEFDEFKQIFIDYFSFYDPKKSYKIYEERILQEKKELMNYFKDQLKNYPNKKSNIQEIQKLKKLIMKIRQDIKKERQQCPFCVRSLKKLKFHLFRINIEQKLLGCKYFQDEIAKTETLEKQIKLYAEALKYGAPNIKYNINDFSEAVKEEFKNKAINNNLDALNFCRFLWKFLVKRRAEDILIKKSRICLNSRKSIIEKDSTQENEGGKNKFIDLKKNDKEKIGDFTTEESENFSLDDMVKKGLMKKIVLGEDNKTFIRKKRGRKNHL